MSSFTVNGQPVHYRMDPDTPLLWALRDASNLTGAKYGCGTGHCGHCMVHVDGNAVRSCRVPISALEGSFITTIEGLSSDRSHPVQQAFIADMVVQCGFCIPGVIMAAAAPCRPRRRRARGAGAAPRTPPGAQAKTLSSCRLSDGSVQQTVMRESSQAMS